VRQASEGKRCFTSRGRSQNLGHLTLSEPDREVRGGYHFDVGITLR
jgi:hypothetical protein